MNEIRSANTDITIAFYPGQITGAYHGNKTLAFF